MMSQTDVIRVDRADAADGGAARDGAVATVTLNRPDKLNALDGAAWRRLAEVFEKLSAKADLRCIVLTGAGGRAFSAGADITAFSDERADATQAAAYGRDMDAAIEAIAGGLHPTIAAIDGLCVGGGLEIACACDLRICSASSRFGIPINRLGLTMGWGELRALLSVVSAPVAREILYTGELFDAPRAQQMGLVNRIVDAGGVGAEGSDGGGVDGAGVDGGVDGGRVNGGGIDGGGVLATAHELAARIAAGAPLVNRRHKRFIRRLADPAPLTGEEIAEAYAAFDTEDFRRGYRAFLAKTEPEFEGD